MQVKLLPNEKIEDLQCDGLKIIQSETEYRFTTDAVLLANFCRDMKGKFCVEFGAGSGVISLLLAKKKRPKRIVAMEIQSVLADMAVRSVQLNGLQDQIEVLCCDLKDAAKRIDSLADEVVCNPPYRKVGSGEIQRADNLAVCRHELKATLRDVVANAAKILNNRGNFYLVHQASRICEIVCLCGEYKLAVKEILPVCPRPNTEPNLVLVRAVKCGESDCTLRKPMSVLDENGNYTPEAKAWYGVE
ncbi:MAG: methyltransferase [Corallococcus sp.]|nr:methyltransferase [Corallococcus sp.]MCM1359791.1 methyltransferase [Corallococcus sp.]MCM1395683.1 methyltransferase [Corallococcus sp.]